MINIKIRDWKISNDKYQIFLAPFKIDEKGEEIINYNKQTHHKSVEDALKYIIEKDPLWCEKELKSVKEYRNHILQLKEEIAELLE